MTNFSTQSDPTPPPLMYAEAVSARPGLMTAVGVMSIVVGCLSGFFSLIGILSSVMYLFMSRASTWATTVTTLNTNTGTVAGNASTTVSIGSTSVNLPTTLPAAPMVLPSFRVDPRASMLLIGEAVLSVLVAALLIYAGTMLLRSSPKARRLHKLYIGLKLPLIAIATFATWWSTSTMMSGMMSSGAALPMNNFPQIMAILQAAFHAIFALAYPVALLIVLSTQTSKSYFRQLEGELKN